MSDYYYLAVFPFKVG